MIIKEKLKEGDVIFTNCVGNQLCYHTGIVYAKGNKKYVFHNAPTNMNKYGGTIVSEPIEVYKKNRDILKIVRTNVKNQDILNVTRKYKDETWDTFHFNCEDYITEIVQGERESDIRDAYKVVALSIALMLII
jgi:hypothetical protein